MAAVKPISAEDTQRLEFIKKRFKRYYSSVTVEPPSSLENREFGVITERGGMWRHLGFARQKDMQDFLVKQAPLHAYHSSTYYKKPNARTMDEKGWLGADLIFDLDADHIQGTEEMNMEEMLAAVKVQFLKLVREFLLGDFGFDEKEVKIVFSGGRGYHAHVSNEHVKKLDSHERREIVDYITLPNPDIDALVKKDPFDNKAFQGHFTTKHIYRLYPLETPGWRGKTTHGVLEFIKRTEGMAREEILEEFTSFRGIGDTLAQKMYESLYSGKKGHRGIDKIANNLTLEPFSEDSVRNSFINHVVKGMSVRQGGETDEPVTSDIKRLIRLPGSLHGKTSLVVKTMSFHELADFIPLRDSVWSGFDGPAVKVIGTNDHDVKIRGEAFKVSKGEETELPEHAALMLSCQRKCNIRN